MLFSLQMDLRTLYAAPKDTSLSLPFLYHLAQSVENQQNCKGKVT